MKIFEPRVDDDGDDVVVSARVEVASASTELPRELWFAFPRSYRRWVADDLNGFAVALLPLAMTLGEDLHADGVLSPRLFRGLQEFQQVQCAWKPTSFRPVEITATRLEASRRDASGGGVVSSFSGGVDSFYTLWRHLPDNEPNPAYRISHCLMINGFDADSDVDDRGHFSRIRMALEPVLTGLGVQLVVCRTNYMSFSDPNILKQSFGAMVTAPALVLGPMVSCFFIPASYRFNEFFRDGSHLLLDHLIATESMETVHDASHLMRPERTAVVSAWSATYNVLRVCFNATGYREDTGSIVNCGRCEKCIRTMKTLELSGTLDRYATFSRKPSHLDVWRCYYGDAGARLHAREILRQAWKQRRLGVWLDFCIAIAVSLVVKIPRSLLQRVHLALEERSETYAVSIRRLLPRLRRRARWIR